ncbi:MAG: response regulator [Chloroflexaceae bacterium]|jgi:DNA-binding NtrC family response regulator|nr:response regulator [Chloroflexaceae bacterium]
MSSPSTCLRILIVDDDVAICRNLHMVLEMEGYAVEQAHSGTAALAHLSLQSFDLLITDLAMPDINGMALIRHCKERNLDLTVIIMTGYGSIESAIQALQLGAYDYVLKPFEPKMLLAAVARAAERQHLRQELEERRNLALLSQMAYTLRHEVNNPLAAIMGLAQLHLDDCSLSDELRADLETISHSARRISDVLQGLAQYHPLPADESLPDDGNPPVFNT